ncbi:MAG: APC family permease [Myxococcales bacterium]
MRSFGLQRLLGVTFGIAVAVGNAIGSGILKAPGEIAALLPAPGLFLGVWVAGGLYAFLSALCIAELATMIPRAGGQYAFARRAFGDYAGLIVGASDWLSTCGSAAAVALVIGEYLSPGHAVPIAVGITLFFALLQMLGVRISARVQEWTSLLKTLAFAFLIAACFAFANSTPHAAVAPRAGSLLLPLLLALQAVIFTYDGWTGVIYFSEEVADPARDVPRSLFSGVALIAAIYLLVNVALVRLGPLSDYAGAPLAVGVAAAKLFGAAGEPALRGLTIVSMIAAIHAYHLMAARVLFGLARDGLFFRRVMEVNRVGTPVPALLVSAAVAILFISSGTFEQVIAVLSFFFVANYSVSFAALFVLRRREPDTPRPFRAPLHPFLPAVTLAGSLAFLGGSIAGDRRGSLIALGLLAASALGFLALRRR